MFSPGAFWQTQYRNPLTRKDVGSALLTSNLLQNKGRETIRLGERTQSGSLTTSTILASLLYPGIIGETVQELRLTVTDFLHIKEEAHSRKSLQPR